jgi:hypothetical protein
MAVCADEIKMDDWKKDSFGNKFKESVEIKDGKLRIVKEFLLEEGKTTTRGQYPKLADDKKCKHPERLSCNYGEGFKRCEFMKYFTIEYSMNGTWKCTYKP